MSRLVARLVVKALVFLVVLVVSGVSGGSQDRWQIS